MGNRIFAAVSILKLRKTYDLSQEEMARRLGVNSKTIWRWESGRTKPSPLAQAGLRELAAMLKAEASVAEEVEKQNGKGD